MKIDVLYFDGCPHHKPAVALVEEVVAAFIFFRHITWCAESLLLCSVCVTSECA